MIVDEFTVGIIGMHLNRRKGRKWVMDYKFLALILQFVFDRTERKKRGNTRTMCSSRRRRRNTCSSSGRLNSVRGSRQPSAQPSERPKLLSRKPTSPSHGRRQRAAKRNWRMWRPFTLVKTPISQSLLPNNWHLISNQVKLFSYPWMILMPPL